MFILKASIINFPCIIFLSSLFFCCFFSFISFRLFLSDQHGHALNSHIHNKEREKVAVLYFILRNKERKNKCNYFSSHQIISECNGREKQIIKMSSNNNNNEKKKIARVKKKNCFYFCSAKREMSYFLVCSFHHLDCSVTLWLVVG